MSEEMVSSSVPGLSAETIATLLNKFEEQNLLIQQLKDRVVLLEGRASEPPSIASPVPVPLQSDMLVAFAKAHADSLAALSNASSPSPSVPLGRDASVFSPTFSPPFGYPYGPYPGFYYPGMHYPPSNWGAVPNHSSAASHPPTDAPATDDNNGQTTITAEKSPEAASVWGGPVDNGISAPSTGVVVGSNSSLNSVKQRKSKVKPCKFGDQCNRPECWFEHPSRAESGPQRNDSPNSMYPPKSSNNATSTPRDFSKQPAQSTKSRSACRYAENCTRHKCIFTHPLGWTPSLALESTDDQNTSTLVDHSVADRDWGTPAAGDSGWDTEQQEITNTGSNEWESWEVKPSNDWGVPSTNEWGPPASNENEWGPPANNEWTPSSTSNNQTSSSANKSTKVTAAKKPDRKGKERVTSPFQSTPSQLAVSTHPATVDISPDSAAEPLADIKEPSFVDEPSIADAVVDSLLTPALEPEHTYASSSSLSEPDNLPTPFAWGDEPLDNVRDEEQAPEETAASDMIAQSSMYDSWGPVEESGWGDDPPAPRVVEAQAKSAKGKGKQKETGQGKAVDDFRTETNDAPLTDLLAVDINAVEGPQTTSPEPARVPQGVPEDEIPDWLLGKTEDPYAALGIARPTTPKPTPRPTPTPTVSTSSQPPPPPNRPRMSEMNGANFPPPQATTNYQAPKTSVASGPTIRPRRTAFTIISDGEPSTAQNARSGGSKESGKGSGKQSKKQYRPNKNQNAKGSK